jgi:ADP-ribose pyrophosphatase YjhB (NUDIX family)
MGTIISNTRPLQAGDKRGWTVKIDGAEIKPNIVEIESHFGKFVLGMTASGYHGWTFHEPNGGGSIIVPFVFLQGKLFIGVIYQKRPHQNIKDETRNVPRGFSLPDEKHSSTAKREFEEETGYMPPRIHHLDGEGGNPNNAFFETWGPGEGIKTWAVEFSPEELDLTSTRPTINPNLVKRDKETLEGVLKVKFFTYDEITKIGDLMTHFGVNRLIAWLQQAGRLPHF